MLQKLSTGFFFLFTSYKQVKCIIFLWLFRYWN